MPKQPTARERIERWLTRRHPADVKVALDAYRDQVLTEAAAMLRAHCPQHADAETAFMDCHCPAATELDRAACASQEN